MVHMVVPFGMCKVVCYFYLLLLFFFFWGGYRFSLYPSVGRTSRSGFICMVEDVRFGDCHTSRMYRFTGVCVVLLF